MIGHIERIKSGDYNEGDVSLFYIQERERRGPFIKEIGDFVAHPVRDKGGAFKASIYQFAQIYMFDRYFGFPRRLDIKNLGRIIDLPTNGACEWWVKPYFIGKAERTKDKNVKKNIGMSKRQLLDEINSWFPKKNEFPTEIHVKDKGKLMQIRKYFARTLDLEVAFNFGDVREELNSAFSDLHIDKSIIDDFIVGTGIAVDGLSLEVPGRLKGKIGVSLGSAKPRTSRSPFNVIDGSGNATNIVGLDGNLSIHVGVASADLPNLTHQFALIETDIDTRSYFEFPLEYFTPPEQKTRRFQGKLGYRSSPKPRVLSM